MDDELKHYLEGMESRIKADIIAAMTTLEDRLTERMRDMQTVLLRGFEAFSAGQVIRVRKVEADQSNLNSALSGRVDILESRLLQIELRLGRMPDQKGQQASVLVLPVRTSASTPVAPIADRRSGRAG